MIKSKKGYSLIELTIVVGLISILSITISAIVLTTITNSNRIKNKVRVRQIGDYTVGQIETMVHNSREINSCDSTTNVLSITNQDAGVTQIFLDNEQIASNSGVFLTPSDAVITNYDLMCLPSDTQPQIVKISFTVGKANSENLRAIENPSQTFSLTAGIRNE